VIAAHDARPMIKRALVLALLTQVLCGCGERFKTLVGLETPTPVPITPVPKPLPKAGDWMWKDHGNPLDQKPRR
jgi:hypothetical protein